jgi:putative transposase
MSKAYPRNLTQAQLDYLNDLISAAKAGERPRNVDLWEVLNGIFYGSNNGYEPCEGT